MLYDERRQIGIAFALQLTCRPDDGQFPHFVGPAPPLDHNLLTPTLENPFVLHEWAYRSVGRMTLQPDLFSSAVAEAPAYIP